MEKQSTLTAEQQAANKLLKDAKTSEEKAAAEAAVNKANEAAEKAAAEAAKKEEEAKAAAFDKSEKVPVLKKTKDNYVPAPGTENNYHVKVEKKAFNPQSGERISTPKVQVYAPKAFINFAANCVGLGYYVTVLHDPTGEYKEIGMDVVEAKAKAAKKAAAKK